MILETTMNNSKLLSTSLQHWVNARIDREAKIFIEVGQSAMVSAETEISFGEISKDEYSKAGKGNKSLAQIALWHYEKGLARFQEAIANFEHAKTFPIPPKYREYIESNLKKCAEQTKSTFNRKSELFTA